MEKKSLLKRTLKTSWKWFKRLTLGAVLFFFADFGIRSALSRPLTTEEMKELKTVFNNTLNYKKIRVAEHKASIFFPDDAMGIFNTIYIPYKKAFTPNSYTDNTTFFHEATHIWQNQNNIPNTGLTGAFKLFMSCNDYRNDCYKYTPDSSLKLVNYNMEQQGNIVDNYYTERERIKLIFDSLKTQPKESPLPLYIGMTEKYRILKKMVEKNIPQEANPALFNEIEYIALADAKKQARIEEIADDLNIKEKVNYIFNTLKSPYIVFNAAADSVKKDLYHDKNFTIDMSEDSLTNTFVKIKWTKVKLEYKDKLVFLTTDDKINYYKTGPWVKELDKLYKQTLKR